MISWNWQKKDCPKFTYDKETIAHLEAEFLQRSGVFLGALKYLPENDKTTLTVDLISNEALKTSEIEGEILNRDSLHSSIRCHFGLDADNRKIPPAEQGIADMMTDLYRHYGTPLSNKQLFTWHTMLARGRQDLKQIGAYRQHKEAMQVISGPIGKQTVHFEAPPSKVMRQEMKTFIHWFNDSGPNGSHPLPALTRAGIAHLYFVSIHPFEDGNGRIARGIAEKSLSQCLGYPSRIALSQTIGSHRRAYYKALEQNNRNLELSNWLNYFANTILDAQLYTQRLIDFLIEKTRLYDRVQGKLNSRQEKVIAKLFAAGLEGFKGGLSAENYLAITKTSRATATRDLQDLVEIGALLRTGERKHTRYTLNIAVMSNSK